MPILPPSTKNLVQVFFWAPKPQDLIVAGFDSLRVERRKNPAAAWVIISKDPYALVLEPKRYNYNFVDPDGERGNEYRAVLQNSLTPGTPPDQPQPITRGVSTDYEMVMTVQELKENYLWGEDSAFITDDGVQQPDYVFAHNIMQAIAAVEKRLDIKLTPTRVVETHDWVPSDMGKGYLSLTLYEFPLLEKEGTPQVETLKLRLPGSAEYVYPAGWLRVQGAHGQVDVVPDGSGSSPSSISPRVRGFIPQALEVTYWAGWAPGDLPRDIKETVGKEASLQPLNVGGDLVGGAGLAGTSLSLDGLSQSVTTTNSSTNAGFGARILMYRKELAITYKYLDTYYKGLRMVSA